MITGVMEGGDGSQELADQGPQAEGVALIPAHDGEVKDHHHEQYAHQQAGTTPPMNSWSTLTLATLP